MAVCTKRPGHLAAKMKWN